MTDSAPPDELKNVGYELFILLLSILSICNLVIVVLASSSPRDVALVVDAIIAPVFLADFLYRLLTARSRRRLVPPAIRLGGPDRRRAHAPRLPRVPDRAG